MIPGSLHALISLPLEKVLRKARISAKSYIFPAGVPASEKAYPPPLRRDEKSSSRGSGLLLPSLFGEKLSELIPFLMKAGHSKLDGYSATLLAIIPFLKTQLLNHEGRAFKA